MIEFKEQSEGQRCVFQRRRDECERFVNSAKQSAALMFTRVTPAAGRALTCRHLYVCDYMYTYRRHKQ